jgi:asparagine synthase (glutamine-hydrolysing)
MCGIAGFLGLPGDRATLDAQLGHMLGRLVHRGPNDEGRWLDASRGAALGMRRLSVIDLPGGHQPLWNEDRTIGTIFNGEIYNHRTLRAELTARGHVFSTSSDTEVLVHLYEELGTRMFDRLQGMYALGIVDLRRQTLLLARDPFGQKPLYVMSPGSGQLAFASEAKALKALSVWRGEVDVSAYLAFATWLSLPAPHTHWRGVTKFAPGEWRLLRLDDAQEVERGATAALRFARSPDLVTAESAAVELEAALRDSVARHLQADVPVGLLLSGGSDSLALGWAAAQGACGRLHTFTAGFRGLGNEFEPARRTAALLDSVHHEIDLPPDCLEKEIDAVLYHLDEPIGDPAAVAVLAICRQAREHVTVLLGGEGADELFAGYSGRYLGLSTTWTGTRRLNRLLGWLPGGRPTGFASSRLLWLWQRAHTSPDADLLNSRAEGFSPHHPWIRSHAPQLLPRWREMLPHYTDPMASDADNGLDAAQLLDVRWQLPESLLVKADRMSMAASIELRCPFLDPVVAAIAGRISAPARLDPVTQVGKRPLRALLARHLSDGADRPKHGFPVPLGRWLRGPLADDVRDHLTAADSQFVALVGHAAAKNWCEEFIAGKQSAHLTYALWMYERWRMNASQPAA